MKYELLQRYRNVVAARVGVLSAVGTQGPWRVCWCPSRCCEAVPQVRRCTGFRCAVVDTNCRDTIGAAGVMSSAAGDLRFRVCGCRSG